MAKYYSTKQIDEILCNEAMEQATQDQFLAKREGSGDDNYNDFLDWQRQQTRMEQEYDYDCDFDLDDFSDFNDSPSGDHHSSSCYVDGYYYGWLNTFAEESPNDEQTIVDDCPMNECDSDTDDTSAPEAFEKGITRERHSRRLNRENAKKSTLWYVVAREKRESTKRLVHLLKDLSKLEMKFERLDAKLCKLDAVENCDMIACKHLSHMLKTSFIKIDEMKNEINIISSEIEFYDRALKDQHINELLPAFKKIRRKKSA